MKGWLARYLKWYYPYRVCVWHIIEPNMCHPEKSINQIHNTLNCAGISKWKFGKYSQGMLYYYPGAVKFKNKEDAVRFALMV